MYTLLIVEDEEIIRKGIANTILSNNMNFKILSASNGYEALEEIETNKIDAMILDIRMPKMDGLELLNRVSDKKMNIKTVVLSGYDQFEYAQAALKYGVIDYVLKPIKPKDIIRIAKKIENVLEKEETKNQELQLLKKYYLENITQLREKFFNDIINRKIISGSDFVNRVKLLKLKLFGPNYQVVIMEVARFNIFYSEEKKQLIYFAIYKYLEKKVSNMPALEFFQINTNQFIFVFNIDPSTETSINSDNLNDFIKDLEKEYYIEFAIGIGSIYEEWSKIRKSFFEANYAVRYCVLSNKEKVIDNKDIEYNRDSFGTQLDLDDISIMIKMGKIDKIRAILNDEFITLEESAEEGSIDVERLNLFCIKIIVCSLSALKDYNLEIKNLDFNELDILSELNKCKTIIMIKEYLIGIIEKIVANIASNCSERKKTVIEKAKYLINQNFHNDITIKSIADALYLSPNYLGYLFKNEMDMSYNDYLNRVRIKEAKKLLKNSEIMIYEVAEKVGFNDAKYFSQVFKNIVGISPKEYKEM